MPSDTHCPSVPAETQVGGSGSNSHNSLLAQQALVSSPNTSQFPRTGSSPAQNGSAVPGHDSSPVPGSPAVKGLVLEGGGRLEALGCPEEVIPTLLNARRSTNRAYERIWAKFSIHMSSRANSCSIPAVQDILSFLQSDLDLSLSVSSLRVQVSVISALTGVSWARHALIQQFFKEAVSLRPQRKPMFPKWDFPLVLEFFSPRQTTFNQRAYYQNCIFDIHHLSKEGIRNPGFRVKRTFPNFFFRTEWF